MRDIKFRAWHRRKKEWFKYSFYICEEGKVWTPPDMIEEDLEEITNEVEITQYTGLKDKNNIEVFEGDIIRMDEEAKIHPNQDLVIEDWFGIFQAHPVGNRFFVSDIHELCKDGVGNDKPKHGIAGVVIGNIYSNPELLKEKVGV